MPPKPRKDPFRTLSRKTRSSIENSPEVQAHLDGSDLVLRTWGGYATRAIDLDLCEPNVEAVKRLLGGDRWVDLSSPDIVFGGIYGSAAFNDYQDDYISQREAYYRDDLNVEVRRLEGILDILVKSWRIPEEMANLRANELQEMLDDRDGSNMKHEVLLCIKRDALASGIEVDFATFTQELLRCNVLSDEFPSELAQGWIAGIREALRRLYYEYQYFNFENVYPDEIYVSVQMAAAVKQTIRSMAGSMARERAEIDWATLEPVFLLDNSHRTLSGTEI